MPDTQLSQFLDQNGLDRAWYLRRNPDIDSDTDAAAHYHLIGWRQRLDPAPWFSTAAYLEAHPDVAEAGVDPFEHWLRHGRAEGRAIFDAGTPVDLVRPRKGAPGDLMSLADAVETAALTAATLGQPEALEAITRFLLTQVDVAVRAARSLAAQDAEQAQRLAHAIDGWSMPDLLRAAAADTRARFPALSLPEFDAPVVTVIVPAFGQFATTYACIESLLTHPGRTSFEVVLVDDASVDETVFASFVFAGGIRILRRPRNEGFVGAVNAAAGIARGRLLMLLNNDTLVHPGWLDALVETIDADPTVGVVGARLLGSDGRVQDAGGLVWRDGGACNLGRGADAGHPEYSRMREVDYVSGAAFLVEAAWFARLGGFDPAYAPGYYEDTDFCFRTRAAGRRVVVQPASRITHIEGATAGRSVRGAGMKRYQERNHAIFAHRWANVLQDHTTDQAAGLLRHEPRVALFIDETTPTPDRDAGSNAALSHMRALQRLGYAVQFVPSHNMAHSGAYTEALERVGVMCHRAPWTASVESVLRQQPTPPALVYLHRVQSAAQYTALVRRHCPCARIVFAVADLHHLRVGREAALTGDATLAREADRLRTQELAAIRAADVTIVHSTAEAAVLSREAPDAVCRTIPWVVERRPVGAPFRARSGVAFIGGFNHHPNPDAAAWLIEEIMPLVWARHPGIELLLIGADMPDAVRLLERPGVRVLGHVPNLHAALARVRLTVSPLRYGAGLKGKVLTSLAAGLPCVMSEVSAEGMALPDHLMPLVCRTAEDHAAAILAVHEDEAHAAALSRAGLAWVAHAFSAARIDGLLREAIHLQART